MNQTDKFINALLSKKNICLTGGGGVGKTWHINKLKEIDTKTRTVYLASTGIASTHLGEEAQTLHRFFGIGGWKHFDDVKQSPSFWKAKGRIRICERIIIDEASMIRSDTFDLIEKCARVARQNEMPFGGIQLIIVGDFFQLPPVVRKDENMFNPWIFQASCWNDLDFDVINLTEVKRQNDVKFINALNEIREGKIGPEALHLIMSRTNKTLRNEPVRLFASNAQADKVNEEMLGKLKGKIESFISAVWSKENKYYHQLTKEILTPVELYLKPKCRIMITSNAPSNEDEEVEYVNGNMGTFLGYSVENIWNGLYYSDESVLVIQLDGGRMVNVPKMVLGINNPDYKAEYNERGLEIRDLKKMFLAFMLQYPVKVGYAITIHKSQGMSLESVEIDFDRIFADGQSYVGLSRAVSLEGLSVKNFSEDKVFANKTVKSFYKFL